MPKVTILFQNIQIFNNIDINYSILNIEKYQRQSRSHGLMGHFPSMIRPCLG